MWTYREFSSADMERMQQTQDEESVLRSIRGFRDDNEKDDDEYVDLIAGSVDEGWFLVMNLNGRDNAICLWIKDHVAIP